MKFALEVLAAVLIGLGAGITICAFVISCAISRMEGYQ